MATETAEPPVILYNTLAPLLSEEEHVQDEYIALSPSSSGYATTEAGLQTMNQTVTEVSTSSVKKTTFRSIMTSSSAPGTLEAGVRDEPRDRPGAISAFATEKSQLRHRVDSGVQHLVDDVETDFAERMVERVVDDVTTDSFERAVQVEATGRPLIVSSKDEGEDFLSLEVGDLEDEIVAAEVVLAEEGKEILTDIKTSAALEAPPWARTGRSHGTWFRSPFLQLHQEIVDFCNFVAPTEEEKELRAAAVERVSDVIKSIWPSCQVKVFGSFATGLFLPTSDCDVVILDSGCQVPQDGLKAIAKALNRKSLVKNLQVIGKARVPIVKFVETDSNIAFDISFDVANGPDAAEFIRDAMTALPPLKPLCLVVKIFLQQRELNEVYTGGIGSYALLVMLLTHLQMHPSRRNVNNRGEPSPLESNLGILLVDFFDFYGRMLNAREVGISCRNGGRFFSKISRGFFDSGRPYLLSVEDPQSPDNDIGKNSYNVTKVRQAFVLAHRQLTKLEAEESPPHVGLLGRIVRMDKILIERKSIISESPARLNSKVRLPDAGPSFSGPAAFRSNTYASGTSGGSRWQDYEDDDFPRGGDPEPESKSSRKRKHAKDRDDRSKRDGDSHKSHSHHKKKREDFEHKGESSSGKASRLRQGKDLVDLTSANSPLNVSRYQERMEIEQVGSGDIAVSNKSVSKQLKRRGVNASQDAVVLGRRTPDGKKNRWRKQNRQQKEDALEEGEIILKDDFATLGLENEQQRDDVTFGAGNGHNKHRRWFNEGRSSKPAQSRTDLRPRSPEEEDVGTSRSVRKVVITKSAHKKIKYL